MASPLDRHAVARVAAAAIDGTSAGSTPSGSSPWPAAFAALGLRPPPPAALAIELPPGAPRATLLASFARLADRAAAESASRSGGVLTEALFEAAWVAAGGAGRGGGAATSTAPGAPEAGGPALSAAAGRAGLEVDLPARLRRARAPTDLARAAAAGGGVPYAAFRAALLADGS